MKNEESLKQLVQETQSELQAHTSMSHHNPRRSFLRKSAAVAGSIGSLGLVGANAGAAPLPIPKSNQMLGRGIPDEEYGMPSKFESKVKRRRSDVLKNRQNFSDWSMTPLQDQHGIVTPNGLIYERHHNGVPEINPDEHVFVIHGLVERPLKFTMSDLMRYPSVSKFYFMECSGNGLTDWLKPASKTVQQSHGLLSCAQWTGIPLAWLLDEAGRKKEATWLLAEGADGAAHIRSLPMKKALDDTLLVFAQNGEMLRPENGYPLRLFVPGWEGNISIKWLRRIKLGTEPWNFRSETARYTDPMPNGKWRQFSFEMETKSVITRPSGDMKIERGPLEIEGFAWSGTGTIKGVDVTMDGGRTWHTAQLEEPVMDKCLTRFRYRWNWQGEPAVIASRAIDNHGYVQPTVAQLQEKRAITGFVQHHNGIMPWAISQSGEVSNAIG